MPFHFSRGPGASRRLRCRALTVLLFAACPGPARAQDATAAAALSPIADSAAPRRAADLPVPATGSVGLLAEPHFISQGLDFATKTFKVFGDLNAGPTNGFYADFSNMITGSGMISAGPGYRHTVLDGKAFVDASAALSWLSYQMAQARFEFPDLANGRLTLGSQVMYQDAMQVNYFGIGNDALAVQSQYRLRTTDVAGYAEVEVAEGLSIGGEVGWLKRPQVLATAGSFNSHYPAAQAAYPADPGMSAAFQPNFIRAELSLTANTLDSRSHPTEGRLYRSAVTTYKDQSAGTFSFDQYEAEAVQMVPVVGKRLLLGLHAWTVFTDVPAGHQVPFYLMPAIGGNNTLRAFDDYRFHDQNTLVATAELRLALLTHVDLAGFVDAGNAAEHYSNLNFKKTSVGVGVRMHTQRATFGRVDVAHGSEGWAFVVRTNDPFKLSRVTRKLSSVPFMP